MGHCAHQNFNNRNSVKATEHRHLAQRHRTELIVYDVYHQDESDPSHELAADEIDPMFDDMLRESEVVEEEEEVH